jgi:hypothetical protein
MRKDASVLQAKFCMPLSCQSFPISIQAHNCAVE